jgi:Phosphoesterase family
VLFGDYAVHTIQPHLQPYSSTSTPSQRLPMLHTPNIGDELTAKGVSWAWYSGRWDNAAGITTGPGWANGMTHRTCTDPNRNPADAYPYCADKLFRYHHQPFNFYANYAHGSPGRGAPAGRGGLSATKPPSAPACLVVRQAPRPGKEHLGHTDVASGGQHLADHQMRSGQATGPPRQSWSPTTSTADSGTTSRR